MRSEVLKSHWSLSTPFHFCSITNFKRQRQILIFWELWRQNRDNDDVNIFLVIVFRFWLIYISHSRVLLKSQIGEWDSSHAFIFWSKLYGAVEMAFCISCCLKKVLLLTEQARGFFKVKSRHEVAIHPRFSTRNNIILNGARLEKQITQSIAVSKCLPWAPLVNSNYLVKETILLSTWPCHQTISPNFLVQFFLLT